MLQSHVIEVEGAFVGAAVRQTSGYRFVAVDCRLAAMEQELWSSLADLQRTARRMTVALPRPAGPASPR